MNLTIILPFYKGDLDKAKNLLQWINELGGCKPNHLLLSADSEVSNDDIKQMKELAKESFSDIRAIKITVPADKQGWPKGCNYMFLKSAEYIYKNYRTAFFWLEPDCIPLKPKWANALAKEYETVPTKYMGAVIEQKTEPTLPNFHMTGCGVYPQDAWLFFKEQKGCVDGDTPWDIVNGKAQVAACTNTFLINHIWGMADNPPILVAEKKEGDPDNYIPLSMIPKTAVVFHRDKAQNLIKILREKKGGASK